MLVENSGSQPQDNQEQPAQTESAAADQSNVDLDQERSYSKKQRQRAQAAEAENEKLTARLKKLEEDQLAEQNKFQELWERDKDEAEWARNYKKSRKSELLDRLPEEDRADFENLNVEALSKVVKRLEKSDKKEIMKSVPGGVNPKVKGKDFTQMTDQEKRENWDQIVASFSNKKI